MNAFYNPSATGESLLGRARQTSGEVQVVIARLCRQIDAMPLRPANLIDDRVGIAARDIECLIKEIEEET